MSDIRAYPERPFLAVSAAIVRDGKVLVVRRARPPAQDLFTLPGGVVETGETLTEAVMREVREETQLEIEPVALAGYREVVVRDESGRVERHFVILCFAARCVSGEPVLNEELAELRWLNPGKSPGCAPPKASPKSSPRLSRSSAWHDMRRPMKRLFVAITIALLLAVSPARAQSAAPFDGDLQRLSEILGALHYLRTLCGANEGQKWRNQMEALVDAEAPAASAGSGWWRASTVVTAVSSRLTGAARRRPTSRSAAISTKARESRVTSRRATPTNCRRR